MSSAGRSIVGLKHAILVLALLVPASAWSDTDDYSRLGTLERAEVDSVLTEINRAVEPNPNGKAIGAIEVVTRDVFSTDDGFLRVFNIFHATTRTATIRRELLFHAGEQWNQERIDESLRSLRDPLFHNILVILPMRTAAPGRIDVLVVVRDLWSLRLNSSYEVQGNALIRLAVSLAENNLFGLRKTAAISFALNQNEMEVGPTYYDNNIFGTRLTLRTTARLLFERSSGELEGTRSETVFAYPLWSLRETWGGSLTISHFVGVQRSFIGTRLRSYDDPSTAEVETVPWIYNRRELSGTAEIVRAFGTDIVQRVAAGYEVNVSRPSVPGDFDGTAALRAAFERDVLPRSEFTSGPYLRWQLFTPIYAPYRDLQTFDFREDIQLGPSVSARLTAVRTEFGSDENFLRVALAGQYTWGLAGGLYRAAANFSARLQGPRQVDRVTGVDLFAASPILGSTLRVLAAFSFDLLEENEANGLLVLGGDNGLRGYPVNQFSGQARILGHLEVRTRPLRLLFFRLGAVAFWDLGHVAPTPSELEPKHGVGAGLRLLIPQLDAIVVRIDWAFALNDAGAGWPGRFSLGVSQIF